MKHQVHVNAPAGLGSITIDRYFFWPCRYHGGDQQHVTCRECTPRWHLVTCGVEYACFGQAVKAVRTLGEAETAAGHEGSPAQLAYARSCCNGSVYHD